MTMGGFGWPEILIIGAVIAVIVAIAVFVFRAIWQRY
jgi:hypothetical protein